MNPKDRFENAFGKLLRFYRERGYDAEFGKKLTQERLGELIGRQLSDAGYTGAAVSEWERGKSKIGADQRTALASLIIVLYENGGIRSLEEADTLLLAGNYRPLNDEEKRQIFRMQPAPLAPQPDPASPEVAAEADLWNRLSKAVEEELFLGAGPDPAQPAHWTEWVLAALRYPSRRFSGARTIAWIGAWLAAWALTFPATRWPFADAAQALRAVVAYIVGAVLVPALAGHLTYAAMDAARERQEAGNSQTLWLITLQGAFTGFAVGYMLVFAALLALHWLGFSRLTAFWEGSLAIGLVVLSHAAARQTPVNLRRAYGRLHLADSAVFFVFLLYGPLWGLFFLWTYPLLLSLPMGPLITFLAAGITIGAPALRGRIRR